MTHVSTRRAVLGDLDTVWGLGHGLGDLDKIRVSVGNKGTQFVLRRASDGGSAWEETYRL